MVSLSYTEGFYSKPRVDLELLKRYSEGLIALSACLAGEIPRALVADDIEKARETALFYKEVFGDELDEDEMNETIEGLLNDNKELVEKGEWGKLVGILNKSFAA